MGCILVAGFNHETNTFAPTKATWADFESPELFRMCLGEELRTELIGTNMATGGFIPEVEAAGHTVIGSIWAGASPSDKVTADAFERYSQVSPRSSQQPIHAATIKGLNLATFFSQGNKPDADACSATRRSCWSLFAAHNRWTRCTATSTGRA